MANKAKKKDNKNLIIGIVSAVVVAIVVIVAVVLATRGSGAPGDGFFVSDGSKYVMSMDADDMGLGEEEYAPAKVHIVYFYSGDKVTDMKSYYEYPDEASAKAAYSTITGEDEEGSYELSGKYIIMTADSSEYEGMTADDAKQQVEFMEMLKNMDLDDVEDSEDVDVETVEEE